MTEKNYVVNVKNKVGTIVTVRGDSASELAVNIGALVSEGLQDHISAMEEMLLGPSAVTMVKESLGATVVSETPITSANNFQPVPPPVQTQAATTGAGAGTAARNCIHGPMTKREGSGQWGPYKAFYCPTPKGTADQCKPQYVKNTDPEWATF